MSQQEITTDNLIGVIRSIQYALKSGLLTVRRGGGATLEEGTITFVNGQVTQASIGRRQGTDALNYLTIWGLCRFTFASSDSNAKQSHVSPNPKPPMLASEEINNSTQKPTAPYRTQGLNEALYWIGQKGLSRAHRLLFFYIDGTRSAAELAHLMKCREDTIYELLRDLERNGVIQLPSISPERQGQNSKSERRISGGSEF